MDANSLGTMPHVLFFLLKSLSFLLCAGVEYFTSNLDRHLTNFAMQALSFFIRILHLLSSVHGVGVVLDSTAWAELSKGIRVGVVLDMTAWAELDKGIEVGVVLDMTGWAELGKGRRAGEDCVDESKREVESSKL